MKKIGIQFILFFTDKVEFTSAVEELKFQNQLISNIYFLFIAKPN